MKTREGDTLILCNNKTLNLGKDTLEDFIELIQFEGNASGKLGK